MVIMGEFRYITNRILKNKKGDESGWIKVRVKKNSDKADVKYRCPECKHEEFIQKEWKRPFSVKCSKCGNLIRLPRLRDEIKRERRGG